MMKLRSIYILLMLLLSGAVWSKTELKAKGPLHIVGQTPLQTLRLDIVPTRANLLETGHIEISLFNSWTNRWNETENYLLDVEVIQNIFEIAAGIRGNTEVGIFVPVLTRIGGRLDQFITRFHNQIGLGQSGRNQYPQNSISLSFVDDDSGERIVILDESDKEIVLGDISLFSRHKIYDGDGWFNSLTVTSLLRFPVSNARDYYGSGGVDGAFSISGLYTVNPIYIYSTIGYGVYGSGSLYGIDLRPYQWTFFAAVEWPVSKSLSFVIQQLSNSGTSRNFGEFSKPTHELVFGAKQQISSRILLEYSLMENMYIFDNSIDFGINMGITYSP
ncbi:MAG: DUF3187 family protein [candidate division Zixibacteria bacterium]